MQKIVWLLRSRPVLRETAMFSFIGGALSFVSDVLAVFGPVVAWLLFGALVALVAVLVWNAVLLAPRTVAEVKGWAAAKRAGKGAPDPVPPPLPFTADATLFLAITLFFSLATFIGQVAAHRGEARPDAGPQGLYASLIPALGAMQKSMSGVERDLGEIKGSLDEVRGSLENVKQETSADPRKELANLGVAWSGDNFLAAVKDGDERIVSLFLAGGINPASAQSQGRPLPVMLALNQDDPGAMVDRLARAGLDLDRRYALATGMGSVSTTLLGRAIEKGNVPLVQALLRHRVDLDRPIETFGAMGAARATTPLASAVSWKQYEIAGLLLDAGADPAGGDHAAYRELSAALARTGEGGASAEMKALEPRLAPTGAAADKVQLELQLQKVEAELNRVGLESIRAAPGGVEQGRLNARYDELQQERQRLRRALGLQG